MRLGNQIQTVRSVFKHAFEAELIDRPVRFGPGFKRPSKKVLRINRAEQGAKLFTRQEVLSLIEAAGPSLKAMTLLAVNVGLGNSDCGKLPLSALNLQDGWLDYARPKTGVARRAALWPETMEAIKTVLARRPMPKDAEDEGLLFITKYHKSWAKEKADNPLSKAFAKLCRKAGVARRKGLGFYTLRHVFRTVADEAKDQPAVDHVMGHESSHMSSHYRETISDARLRAVVDHVHDWLFSRKDGADAVQ